jgi:hypothetical protein
MNSKVRLIILICALVLILPNAYAIGITPSKITMGFQPNSIHTFKFTALYAPRIDLYTRGDLAEYAEIIDPNPNGGPREFQVVLKLPGELEPGRRTLLVGVIEHAPEGATIGGRAAYQAPIYVEVPYPGVFIKSNLLAPNVNVGEPVDFVVKLENKGYDIVQSLNIKIDVSDALGNHLETITHPTTQIGGVSERQYDLQWKALGMPAGAYVAKATIDYDGEIIELERNFNIGTQVIDIINFTKTAQAGKINPFEVLITSGWNSPFDNVYGQIDINDKKFKTPGISLGPWRNGTLLGYWDATSIEAGTYDVEVVVHYGESISRSTGIIKAAEQTVEVKESPAPVKLGSRGMLALILLVVAIMFVVYRRRNNHE